MLTERIHVITHGDCPDGHTSAWLLKRFYKGMGIDTVFHAAHDRENFPEEVFGDVGVVVADYSYPREALITLAGRVQWLHLMDHHKTAEADLVGLDDEVPNISMIFDMDRSGARIVWDWIGRPADAKTLVLYVEDRDLWRKELPNTDEVGAVIQSTPFTFGDWDMLSHDLANRHHVIVEQGKAILRKDNKVVDMIVETARPLTIGGHDVLVVSSPYAYGSEVAGRLAESNDIPFGAYYVDRPEGRQFGLRSRSDNDDPGFDTSAVARLYGGGGHHNASGFKVPWGHELAPAC